MADKGCQHVSEAERRLMKQLHDSGDAVARIMELLHEPVLRLGDMLAALARHVGNAEVSR